MSHTRVSSAGLGVACLCLAIAAVAGCASTDESVSGRVKALNSEGWTEDERFHMPQAGETVEPDSLPPAPPSDGTR